MKKQLLLLLAICLIFTVTIACAYADPLTGRWDCISAIGGETILSGSSLKDSFALFNEDGTCSVEVEGVCSLSGKWKPAGDMTEGSNAIYSIENPSGAFS